MLTLWNQFDDLFGDNVLRGRNQVARSFLPAVDITEGKESYDLVADVPGVPADAIEITVEDGVLKLRGERHDQHKDVRDGYRRVERSFGRFERTFVLPKGVQSDQVSAKVEHGQLHVRIPKPIAATPRRIEVKAEPSKAS
jgi:HSP20 family protein